MTLIAESDPSCNKPGNEDSCSHEPFSFVNLALPDFVDEYQTAYSPLASMLVFWDDLYIYEGTPQGIYYEVDGVAPNRNLTLEWYTSDYSDDSHHYHFTALFQESVPDFVEYTYLQISDNGASGKVVMAFTFMMPRY